MVLSHIGGWSCQNITLYHGTLGIHVESILNRVDLGRSGPIKDFGRGFYTTTGRTQAEHWAHILAEGRNGGRPAIVRFELSREELSHLDILFFVRGDRDAFDFWSLVKFCRNGSTTHFPSGHGWFDVVAGPVTGNWRKQTIIPGSDQISFHTASAVNLLNACRNKDGEEI